ncbi:MAG: type II toxin-antitoxin system Phd/YefM family antitoxin [Propionibacteriaceae bacterium]|nr:type II toxin-antitoxin system Phd/YefM family antitoxin [Propionibacteriaceae bacterium]
MATISSREFNRDVSGAKREALAGPVVITDRGEPAFVLLSIDDYRRFAGSGDELLDLLSMDDDDEIDFEPLKLDLKVPQF